MTDELGAPAFSIDPRLEHVAEGSIPAEHLTPAELHLRQLVQAAGGPILPEEVVGKQTALAAFTASLPVQAGSLAGASWVSTDHRGRTGRRTGAAAAAAVAAVLLSGVAAAAATGSLPAPMQHVAHRALGAPNAGHGSASATAPGKSHRAERSKAHSSGGAGSASASEHPTSKSPSSSGVHPSGVPAAGSAGGSAAGLCRAWSVHNGSVNPHSAIARSLTSLAGGPAGIPAFCQTVLAAPHGHGAAPSASAAPTHGKGHEKADPGDNGKAKGKASAGHSASSHPAKSDNAKDKGKGKDKGNGKGNGNGKPSPSSSATDHGNGGPSDHPHH